MTSRDINPDEELITAARQSVAVGLDALRKLTEQTANLALADASMMASTTLRHAETILCEITKGKGK